jgi:hypothetical protein
MFFLALSRTTGLAYRANSAHSFLNFLLKIQSAHGSKFTVKWLKAGYVAIQKELGNDGMKSLRVLDPELPLPALRSRLPKVIPATDRAEIRRGNVTVIRFWSSLFNLYRIFKCPGEIKISTITAPFSGDVESLENIIKDVHLRPFFSTLKGWLNWRQSSLTPHKFVLSKAASPSNKVAMFGLLTDIYNVFTHRPDLWETLFHMAFATDPRHTPFMGHVVKGANLISDFKEYDAKSIRGNSEIFDYIQWDHLMTKPSVRAHGSGGPVPIAQFAIKDRQLEKYGFSH